MTFYGRKIILKAVKVFNSESSAEAERILALGIGAIKLNTMETKINEAKFQPILKSYAPIKVWETFDDEYYYKIVYLFGFQIYGVARPINFQSSKMRYVGAP